jgi:anti-sigma regulatory factor (Ser/Thr protein kinase)
MGRPRSDASTERTWFDVAQMVGDRVVPSRADWVVLHVRESVLDVVRRGVPGSLLEAGVLPPVDGEPLTIATLRHADADSEVAVHGVLTELAPRVGDPYGAGRVTATGISRLASQVDPAYLRAIARSKEEMELLARLDIGSSVITPVVAGGLVLGALSLVRIVPGAVSAADLAQAERYGERVGSALDSSRPATALLRLRPARAAADRAWRPEHPGAEVNPVAAARRWVRRTLPEIVDRPVRTGLAEDLDLVVSELASNALRHTGKLEEVRLGQREDAVRVSVVDRDDRRPTVRNPSPTNESGRGMLIVAWLARQWDVEHRLDEGGKLVWAELAI